MGKGACIKRKVSVRNYITNTVMKKTNRGQRGRVGGGGLEVEDMEFARVNLKT